MSVFWKPNFTRNLKNSPVEKSPVMWLQIILETLQHNNTITILIHILIVVQGIHIQNAEAHKSPHTLLWPLQLFEVESFGKFILIWTFYFHENHFQNRFGKHYFHFPFNINFERRRRVDSPSFHSKFSNQGNVTSWV